MTHNTELFEKRKEYRDSLNFAQHGSREATIRSAMEKTCQWVLERREFKSWLCGDAADDGHKFLWIKGKPATGKSTMMKFLLNHVKETRKEAVVISFFFNARGDSLEKNIEGMYRSLLCQLLDIIPSLVDTFESAFPVPPGGQTSAWSLQQLQNLFKSAVQNLKRRTLIVFIDALDECSAHEVRELIDFFDEDLRHTVLTANVNYHTCLSTRHYPHVQVQFGDSLILERQTGHQEDIAEYINKKLKIGNSKISDSIKAEILSKASGVFLWVVLVIDILRDEFDHGNVHKLEEHLHKMPPGLEELLEQIMRRKGGNHQELVSCIQWMLFAGRPLTRRELYWAIISASSHFPKWPAEILEDDMARFVTNASRGFLEQTKGKEPVMQFIHESVREYFTSTTKAESHGFGPPETFIGRSHDHLMQCCRTYQMYRETTRKMDNFQPCNDWPSIEEDSFLEYAVKNVFSHANIAHKHGISQIQFLQTFDHAIWARLRSQYEVFAARSYPEDVSLPYILAAERAPELIVGILEHTGLSWHHAFVEKSGPRGSPVSAAVAQHDRATIDALVIPYRQLIMTNLFASIRAIDQVDWTSFTQAVVSSSRKHIVSILKNACVLRGQYTFFHALKFAVSINSAPLATFICSHPDRRIDYGHPGPGGTLESRLNATSLYLACKKQYWSVATVILSQQDCRIDSFGPEESLMRLASTPTTVRTPCSSDQARVDLLTLLTQREDWVAQGQEGVERIVDMFQNQGDFDAMALVLTHSGIDGKTLRPDLRLHRAILQGQLADVDRFSQQQFTTNQWHEALSIAKDTLFPRKDIITMLLSRGRFQSAGMSGQGVVSSRATLTLFEADVLGEQCCKLSCKDLWDERVPEYNKDFFAWVLLNVELRLVKPTAVAIILNKKLADPIKLGVTKVKPPGESCSAAECPAIDSELEDSFYSLRPFVVACDADPAAALLWKASFLDALPSRKIFEKHSTYVDLYGNEGNMSYLRKVESWVEESWASDMIPEYLRVARKEYEEADLKSETGAVKRLRLTRLSEL